jgi:DNA-binding MarR family transcriptional regulator
MSTSRARPDAAAVTGTSLLYAVKRLELVVRSHLDEMLKPSGVTALQFTALTVLERHDGLSAAQLARDSFVTAQSMADMVRALESRGLVHRERNPANRRELLLHLTDRGRELLVRYEPGVAEIEARMVARLSAVEARAFRHALTESWRTLRE